MNSLLRCVLQQHVAGNVALNRRMRDMQTHRCGASCACWCTRACKRLMCATYGCARQATQFLQKFQECNPHLFSQGKHEHGATWGQTSVLPALKKLGDLLPFVAHPALSSHNFAVLLLGPFPFFRGWIELVQVALPALHHCSAGQLPADLRPLALPQLLD
jgi:hypothetical protein